MHGEAGTSCENSVGAAAVVDSAPVDDAARTVVTCNGQQLNAGIAADYDSARADVEVAGEHIDWTDAVLGLAASDARTLTLFRMRDAAVTAQNAGRGADAGDVRGPFCKGDGCETVPGELPASEAVMARVMPMRAAAATCHVNAAGICESCPTMHQVAQDAPKPAPGSVVIFDVLGVPAAKGSPHARIHNGHVVVHEGKKTKAWEAIVRERILADIFHGTAPASPTFVDKPLRVFIEFRLTRPAGHWGKAGLKKSAPQRPNKKPDIDKLVRATLDPLIGSVMDDDSRIVTLTATKVYADPGREGASISVMEAT